MQIRRFFTGPQFIRCSSTNTHRTNSAEAHSIFNPIDCNLSWPVFLFLNYQMKRTSERTNVCVHMKNNYAFDRWPERERERENRRRRRTMTVNEFRCNQRPIEWYTQCTQDREREYERARTEFLISCERNEIFEILFVHDMTWHGPYWDWKYGFFHHREMKTNAI